MNLLPLLILMSPLAAVPKIYLDQIWLALLFDLVFVIILVKIFTRRRFETVPFHVHVFVGVLNGIAMLEVLNPGLLIPYNALHGYRSTGLYMLAMYVPILATVREDQFKLMIRYVTVMAVFSSFSALRQYVLPLPVEVNYADTAGGAAKFMGDEMQGDEGSFRPFATFVTSVHLALYLSVAMVASYFGRLPGLFNRVAPALIVGGVLITMSRTAYLAVIGMLVVMFIAGLFARSVSIGKTLAYVGMALVIGGVVVSSSDLLLARVSTLGDAKGVSSFQSRFLFWGAALIHILDEPFGYGTGAASWAFKDSLDLGCDSGYLKAFIEFGWYGGAAFCVFLLYMCFVSFVTQKRILGLSKKAPMTYAGAWLLASAGLFQANMIQMFTNQTLEAYPNNFLFWLSCGFLLVRERYLEGMVRGKTVTKRF
jgi:hypothetical protein